MRSFFCGLLLVSGFLTSVVGVEHVGAAWWSQDKAAEFADNNHTLIPSGFVGRLSIPRLNASLYIVDAKTGKDLRRGPGYVLGSTRPGGENCIIAGHRDLHFRILKDIKLGDEIKIESEQGRFTYRVSSFEIVSPTDMQALRPSARQQLTLVTCYPFYYLGSAPKRFIVKASLQ